MINLIKITPIIVLLFSCHKHTEESIRSVEEQITALAIMQLYTSESEGDLYISDVLPILWTDGNQTIKVRPVFRGMSDEEFEEFGLDDLSRDTTTLEFSSEAKLLYPTFKDDWRDGDNVRLWRTPESTWKALGGRAGYAHIRDGKVLSIILTMMN